MICRRVRVFKRLVKTWNGVSTAGNHIEQIVRVTWWLLCIPIYSHDEIVNTDL